MKKPKSLCINEESCKNIESLRKENEQLHDLLKIAIDAIFLYKEGYNTPEMIMKKLIKLREKKNDIEKLIKSTNSLSI